MMRPVLNPPPDLRGTAADQFVFVCRCDDGTPWGLIVFIKTSHLVHSVLVPVLESETSVTRFMAFLKGEGCRIWANRCRFEGQNWYGAKDYEFLEWPTAAFEGPLLKGRVARVFDLWALATQSVPHPCVYCGGREAEISATRAFDHVSTRKSSSTRRIAAHPCKKCKNGAPSVGMMQAKIVKSGTPAVTAAKSRRVG